MLNKIIDWYKKEKKILLSSLGAGVICTSIFAVYTKDYSERIQTSIANEVIRFHIKANSDDIDDQNLKIAIKDEILKEFKVGLDKSNSIDETREFLLSNLTEIEKCAKQVIIDNGYDYEVTANLEDDFFPTKKYGDIYLPAGKYEALNVRIGESKGANWWCVMFPPLCFVDIATEEIPEDDNVKTQLKQVLTEEEYALVSKKDGDGVVPIEVKFKLVEWWQNNKNAPSILLKK